VNIHVDEDFYILSFVLHDVTCTVLINTGVTGPGFNPLRSLEFTYTALYT